MMFRVGKPLWTSIRAWSHVWAEVRAGVVLVVLVAWVLL